MPGRKSATQELEIAQRYSALTEPFFKVLKGALEGDKEEDKKWAVEQLGKAFVKMIPQMNKHAGEEGGPIEITIVKYATGDTTPS